MRIYLAHGASGSAASMQPHVDGLAAHGFAATAVGLPVRRAETVIERYREQVTDLAGSIIGGHSYGGRVASLLAADQPPAGLVLLSYPLHRPGHPEQLRTEHWPRINCPVLLISGEADQFARIDLLREAVALLPQAELVTYAGVGHGVGKRLDDALARMADFAQRIGG